METAGQVRELATPATPAAETFVPAPVLRQTPPSKKSEVPPPVSSPARLGILEEISAPSGGDPTGGSTAWPDEHAEAVYLSEARDRGELPPPVTIAVSKEPGPVAPPELSLPALDELVQKIAPEIRQSLEELFRAKFVSVKRIAEKDLKT